MPHKQLKNFLTPIVSWSKLTEFSSEGKVERAYDYVKPNWTRTVFARFIKLAGIDFMLICSRVPA